MTAASETAFDALWDYNDPAASEARFLDVRQTLGADEDHARLMELDTQIARAQGLQGRFADALAMLELIQGRLLHAWARPGPRFATSWNSAACCAPAAARRRPGRFSSAPRPWPRARARTGSRSTPVTWSPWSSPTQAGVFR